MAIYHFHKSGVRRTDGSSAIAAVSYITGERLLDESTGELKSIGNPKRVVKWETVLPDGCPASWQNDLGTLWNEIERSCAGKNERVAEKLEIALPLELSAADREKLIRTFVAENITAHGYPCTFAIHESESGGNPHVHINCAGRPWDSKKGKWGVKWQRGYVLDENGNKIPIIDKKTGRQKLGPKNRREWKREKVGHWIITKPALLEMRRSWASICNARLPADRQIDHRSYKERGLDVEPTVHEGYAARSMEKNKETVSDRMELNREILDERPMNFRVLAERGERLAMTPEGFGEACQIAAEYSAEDPQTHAAILGAANPPNNAAIDWTMPNPSPLQLHRLSAERLADDLHADGDDLRSIAIRTIIAVANRQPLEHLTKPQRAKLLRILREVADRHGAQKIMSVIGLAVKLILDLVQAFMARMSRNKKIAPNPAQSPIQKRSSAETAVYRSHDVELSTAPHHEQPMHPSAAVRPAPMPDPAATLRPTTDRERREIRDAVIAHAETLSVTQFLDDHAIAWKKTKLKVNGMKHEVLRLPDRSHILVSDDGRHWQWATKRGLSRGGNVFDLALQLVPEYGSDLSGDDAVVRFGREYCPDIVRYYKKRPETREKSQQRTQVTTPKRPVQPRKKRRKGEEQQKNRPRRDDYSR